MLHSMTGFGASSGEEAGFELRIEVRSVNHRHLQVKTRLPQELSGLEHAFEKRARQRLERGSVTVNVALARPRGAPAVALDEDAARTYRDALSRLARELELSEGPSLSTLLGLPGVVRAQDADAPAPDAMEKGVLALLDEALEALVAMRAQEGAALEADLRKHAAALEQVTRQVEQRMPEVVRGHQEQLRKRVDELLAGQDAKLLEQDLAREIAVLADRLDVSEELSRLASHLEQLDGLLSGGADRSAVGRRLDFLVQEIFREVNTVGSKCSDAQVAHWVIDAKTHVERLREQLQNVE